MSYSKISSIILWVVAGISLLVMIFFFVAENTQLAEELDTRVTLLETEGPQALMEPAPAVEIDTTTVDTTSVSDTLATGMVDTVDVVEVDSASLAATMEPAPMEELVVPEEINLKDYLTGWELMVYKRTDYALTWAYILFIIAAIAAVVFPLINIATNTKALLRLLAITAGAAALIILSYFGFASDQTIEIVGYTGDENSNPSILKWVGTGLFTTYVLFGIAIVSILYSEVVKLFK